MNTEQVSGKKRRVLTRRNERRGKSKDVRSILQESGGKSRSSEVEVIWLLRGRGVMSSRCSVVDAGELPESAILA